MSENQYTLKFVVGSVNVELVGPKDFVEPVYGILKPLIEKEVKFLLTGKKEFDMKKNETKTEGRFFEKKPSLPEFYKEKKPSSDIQAAALVGFFYSELAEPQERKAEIDTDILVKGFKLCKHKMPEKPDQTLRNAKNYGYLDSTDEVGKFKLTATGYNLVAHALPLAETSSVEAKKQKPKKGKKTAPKLRSKKQSKVKRKVRKAKQTKKGRAK